MFPHEILHLINPKETNQETSKSYPPHNLS
jgi:hypothetical protein